MGRILQRCKDRGGSTPFNVTVVPNGDSHDGSGGHGAATPLPLMRWWTKYICPKGGTMLDMFAGSGTAGVAAEAEGRNAILIERHPPYVELIKRRSGEPPPREELEIEDFGPLFNQEAAS